MPDQIDFDFGDLAPKRAGVVGPDRKRYVLCEPSETAYNAYQNALARATRYDDTGTLRRWEGLSSAEVILVGSCLCHLDPKTNGPAINPTNGDYVPVGEAYIQGWLHRVISPMFDWLDEVGDVTGKQATAKKKGKGLEGNVPESGSAGGATSA